MSQHAIASPSGASGWLACAGWRASGESSEFAREGTAAHEVAAMALLDERDAAAYIGRLIEVEGQFIPVTSEMAQSVQAYVDYVRDLVRAAGGTLLIEQRLSIEPLTGEPGAAGTSDAVILAGDELLIVDLKFGRGVRVDAQDNEQLQIYALGALHQFDILSDFERVRMVIHQPRLGHVSEWACSIPELRAFAGRVKKAATLMLAADASTPLNPGEKQCRWCAKKATCPALALEVQNAIGADFDTIADPQSAADLSAPAQLDEDDLATKLTAVDLIEGWCKAVRAEAERRLLAGQAVPGFKLVEGRRGARKWTSVYDAEKALKEMRLRHEQMFEYTLVSPTGAEKLVKSGELGERQWARLQKLTTQAEGRPSVAPDSDRRPALAAAADDFELVA